MESNRVLVTGANGHLGRRLIARLLGGAAGHFEIRAAVRSERAAEQVRALPGASDVVIVDYTSQKSLEEAATGCASVVHLVGIIKETSAARYVDAHERTVEALAPAASAAGLDRIVYLSIFGSRAEATNACLASKGRAEETLLAGSVPACVMRVPMVLGPEDFASFSLRSQAMRGFVPMLGGGRTLQQPIDSDDVMSAIVSALTASPAIRGALDLGGPECLSHRALVERAARLYGKQPTALPVPLGFARAGVALLERLSGNPPMTVAMFDVLQHDDRVQTSHALEALNITLTPLDETLRRYVGPKATSGD
jgi:uncharacterized protein YbjT (DUF2867 family)